MTTPTHAVTGLIIRKLTGNYPLALGVSLFLDVDHLYTYAKNGVLKDPKKFWQAITAEDDPYGEQRGALHNLLAWLILSALVFLLSPALGIAFSLAYIFHLILDAIDSGDFWPFFPYKEVNIIGPIGYFSKAEYLFAAGLLVIYVLLLIQ